VFSVSGLKKMATRYLFFLKGFLFCMFGCALDHGNHHLPETAIALAWTNQYLANRTGLAGFTGNAQRHWL
jgi:hypothetical protein